MPTVLKNFEFRTNNKYQLGKYADGRIWRFKRGVDFDCEIARFQCHVYAYAKRLNLKHKTNRDPVDRDSVIVQFLRPVSKAKKK